MRRAAIVSPVRTGVGKFLGSLQSVPAEDLAATVIRETVERSGIDPAAIEDVSFAQSYSNSEAPCIGRWAGLAAGLPLEVPGFQQDRRCGGGLQAIATAAMMVQTGVADAVVAGGVESMSNIEYYTTSMRGGSRAGCTDGMPERYAGAIYIDPRVVFKPPAFHYGQHLAGKSFVEFHQVHVVPAKSGAFE